MLKETLGYTKERQRLNEKENCKSRRKKRIDPAFKIPRPRKTRPDCYVNDLESAIPFAT